MSCSSCGRVNRAESRFCVGCGKALVPRCPGCGAETELDARFCGACGSSLAAPAQAQAMGGEVRKVVTVVFADLIGSTSLHERLDAESTRRLMD
ncbi:MAG: zinc ribbon domain-containing protein, partial [Bryobacteraceae bacterium]|nr:zinc ribbon domain-containing protein [Bryobacteraceae bacterium]